MIGKLKLTGVVLGALASACLVSHRAKMRRALGNPSLPLHRSGRSPSAMREPDTKLDAGGQTG